MREQLCDACGARMKFLGRCKWLCLLRGFLPRVTRHHCSKRVAVTPFRLEPTHNGAI